MNTSVLPISIPDITHPVQALKPYHDRLTIVPDPMPKYTALGLIIPDTVKDKPYSGTIIQVGSRCRHAKTGMRVIFGKWSGTELTINKDKFVLMREADLILDLDTMKPFADRVLICPDHKSKQLPSGLVVPDNVQEQPQTGIGESVGEQCQEIVAGARIIFGKFAGMMITLKDKPYLVVRELDVVGVI